MEIRFPATDAPHYLSEIAFSFVDETAREVREWIYENYPETRPRPKLEYDL